MIPVSPVSNTGEEQQSVDHTVSDHCTDSSPSRLDDASYSGDLIPLVIDQKQSSQVLDEVAATYSQGVERLLSVTEADVEPVDISEHPAAAQTPEQTTTMDSDAAEAVDLTATRQVCPANDEPSIGLPSTAEDPVGYSSPTSVLSEEYKKRYEKYENLCALITSKDRELAQLNDERKRLHQMLVDLQRAILIRPFAAAAATPQQDGSSRQNSRKEVATDVSRDESRQETPGSTGGTVTTAVPFRHRPAHRGVTSVRVMVKSTQPPTAHSTRINLSRYNSLFCNFDEVTACQRRPSTTTDVVAVVSEDSACSVLATDLTSERTTICANSSGKVVPPAVLPGQPGRISNGSFSFAQYTEDERPPEEEDSGYVSRVVVGGGDSPSAHDRIKLVQHQRLEDGHQTSVMSAIEFHPAVYEAAPVVVARNTAMSHGNGPSGALADSQGPARQISDASRHQQFVMATTHNTVLSTARGRADVYDQRPLVLNSAVRQEPTPVFTSPTARYRAAYADVAARLVADRRELRPPPPYPHHRLDVPYPETTAPPRRDQTVGAGQPLEHRAPNRAATYAFRKKNPAGPRMVCVQPMRAENQVSTVVETSSDREVDVMGYRQPRCDVPARGYVVGDATLLGNQLSPASLPALRAAVGTAYRDGQPVDTVGHSLARHVTGDAIQPRSRIARDVIGRLPVDQRPLDQLQHFVDRQRIPSGQQQAAAAAKDDQRLRHLTPPLLMTSGHVNNGDVRGHVIVDFAHQDTGAAVPLIRASDVATDADFAAFQAQRGRPIGLPVGARVAARPLPVQRDPPRGLQHVRVARPLDMAADQQRHFAVSMSQVIHRN